MWFLYILKYFSFLKFSEVSGTTFSDSDAALCRPLSGLHYDKSDATKFATQKWLAENLERLNSIQFVPRKEKIEPQGIFPLSHARKEAEMQKQTAYSKAHITNDLDYGLVMDPVNQQYHPNRKMGGTQIEQDLCTFSQIIFAIIDDF